MKIGMFAKNNNLTIDSVRHYMELGLIIPVKEGGHYDFDIRCQQDLHDILSLKDMGFSLKEIKTIFKYKRLGRLMPYEKDEYYKTLFINKLEDLSKEIDTLIKYKKKLEDKLKETADTKGNDYKIGVSFKALDILRCQKCWSKLMLIDGRVENNQIMDGRLQCSCGNQYIIESGVLKIAAVESQNKQDYKENYINNIRDYINNTDDGYLDNLSKGKEWVFKKVDFQSFNGKVLMELGTGFGYFLRYIYNDLPENCLYIAVDHDTNKLRFLKRILEKTGYKKNILFISADFLNIPIKKQCIDILLDLSGTSNYSFENSEFLLNLTNHYVKESGYLLGSYILFKNFSPNSLIKKPYRNNFLLESIKNSIAKLNYQPIDELISDYIEKGGKHESYFVKGEKIFFYIYYGKR
ncbi:MerR family transcriptional regulator [Alkaliphilus pronyensis]|uniref:MerR family transcriptional regulator n=1 Tax=Alkaliphilus pronyensis TaxID=1482732 RepID=A0A6I0F7R7_9FIRM|nr:methyltransferase domain-containing protein [Alkaliphilus pronyensis]KAB3530213.1 MerR family transcriptional regulator [Alkaliphilus pronyensis]